MKFRIPILIEELKPDPSNGMKQFQIRPVFKGFSRKGSNLARVMARFTHEVRQKLKECSQEVEQSELVNWGFSPPFEDKIISITLDIKKSQFTRPFLVIWFEVFNKRFAMIPEVAGSLFEFRRGEDLKARCEIILLEIYKKHQSSGLDCDWMKEASIPDHVWTSVIDFSIPSGGKLKQEKAPQLFSLTGDDEDIAGDMELENVGHCLSELFPDGLDRAYGRDAEALRVLNILKHGQNRPILLIGLPSSGKTSLINEIVFQLSESRKSSESENENVWHLSPQRLISGMSYVGQWESRFIAILEECKTRNHILYFDDLPGLFQAGQSADSQFSVADVLRTWMEKRQIRILSEMTPEAWRKLREKDRRFADMFEVIHLRATDEEKTIPIIIQAQRKIEMESGSQFLPESLPLIFRLLKQYAAERAFPGKAISFMNQVALKNKNKEIGVSEILDHFSNQTGLDLNLVDMRVPLKYDDIKRQLDSMIAGQDSAKKTLLDIIMMVKARLNDPSRPVASLLFLGPTGVGKTECAKALSYLLFKNTDRLIRIDMNEFLDPGSVQKLIGSSLTSEGILTQRVRQQPFSVVLFDEIEKADPEILDMLLAILGEGRLTDGLGRVVSFANCVVILTSNLGVEKSMRQTGFKEKDPNQSDLSYFSVAREFFKPEFFNRIDHVVPFKTLSSTEAKQVANIYLRSLSKRYGLKRRKSFISFTQESMDFIIQNGFHPKFGGRSMKRFIERNLTSKLAIALASELPECSLLISVSIENNQFSIDASELLPVQLSFPAMELIKENGLLSLLESGKSFSRYARGRVSDLSPGGLGFVDQRSQQQLDYLLVLEISHKVEDQFQYLLDLYEENQSDSFLLVNAPQFQSKQDSKKLSSTKMDIDSRRSLDKFSHFIESTSPMHNKESNTNVILNWMLDASLLNTMFEESEYTELILRLQFDSDEKNLVPEFSHFLDQWKTALAGIFRLEESTNPPGINQKHVREFKIAGFGCNTVAQSEEGCWMVENKEGSLSLIEVSITIPEMDQQSQFKGVEYSKKKVIRHIKEGKLGEDLRTGFSLSIETSAFEVRQMILSQLSVEFLKGEDDGQSS